MTTAIILAGGRATRLGGVDKPRVRVAGRPLIEHALAAAADRDRVVVVGGRPDDGDDRVAWTREDPPFGGPAMAVLAGLHVLSAHPDDADEVLLLAADLPAAVELVRRLDAVPIPPDADGVIAVDRDGRRQWLAGRHRLASLRHAACALPAADGASMRTLLAPLALIPVDVGETARDLDTWAAIDDYRRTHPTPCPQETMPWTSPLPTSTNGRPARPAPSALRRTSCPSASSST